MKSKMAIPILVAVIAIAGTAFALTSNQATSILTPQSQQSSSQGEFMEDKESEVLGEGEAMMEEEGAVMEGDGAMMGESSYSGDVIAGSTTKYLRYNEADFEKATGEGKAVYLYFYATWCPICVAERPNIMAAFNELDVQDAVGFEAHWNDGQNTQEDNDLARVYGVGSQHTHIFIDRDGEIALRTLQPLSKEDIKAKIAELAGA